jgi:nicotinate-nucleotide adenylyltransferase
MGNKPQETVNIVESIGIFGGSFNPPHIGHLILAQRCRELLQLDKIIFIPAYIPPHKIHTNLINPNDRLKMIKLSIKGNPYFDYSDIEIKRKGKSFTYDTLIALQNKYVKSKLFLLIGMDNYNDFCSWKNYEDILNLCKVVVINRHISKGKISKNTSTNTVNSRHKTLAGNNNFIFIDTPIIDISSTEIRSRIKKGLSIKYYIAQSVEKFITKNKLYI